MINITVEVLPAIVSGTSGAVECDIVDVVGVPSGLAGSDGDDVFGLCLDRDSGGSVSSEVSSSEEDGGVHIFVQVLVCVAACVCGGSVIHGSPGVGMNSGPGRSTRRV